MDERKGMLIISGCPRSGTSVTMNINRLVHGEEAMLGSSLLEDKRQDVAEAFEKRLERMEGEEEHEHAVRKYTLTKLRDTSRGQKMARAIRKMTKRKEMNPDGFWEMEFTVRGIAPYVYESKNSPPIYSPELQEVLDDVADGAFKVCKVVSQGLVTSNTKAIGKIIYMIRHPLTVAKSQEKLEYELEVADPETGEYKNVSDWVTIRTPKMYIQVTTQAARFIMENPDIPIRFFHFERLLKAPVGTLKEMQKFVGKGDYLKARDLIKPSYSKSKTATEEATPLMTDALFVYERFCEAAEIINAGGPKEDSDEKLQAILTYVRNPRRESNRAHRAWTCFRAKETVNEIECKACRRDPVARANMKKFHEDMKDVREAGDHWSKEPCPFECGMDMDRTEYLTIEESIADNFWVNDEYFGAVVDTVEAPKLPELPPELAKNFKMLV